MKTAFANSRPLEILGEIAGKRCHEFFIRDKKNLLRISRPFTFGDEIVYLFMDLSKDDDPEVRLKLQTGKGIDDGESVFIDRAVASDKAGCARLSQKIEMLCAALTFEGVSS